jgi:copper oxidase (laccase) domain-containing protein
MVNKNNILNTSINGNKNNIFYEIFGKIENNTDLFLYYNKPVVYTKQEHSICLNMIDNHEFNNTYLLGDGLFTNKKNLYLSIECMDCMGVIIMGNDFAGVVHVSWRNLYLGIIENIFNLLKKESINLNVLSFIITPHLQDNFEVKENFINLWKEHENYKDYLNSEEILKKHNDKYYFSMFNFFERVITTNYNIKKHQIKKIPIDTYTNTSYSSFRRDGLNNNTNKIVVYIK